MAESLLEDDANQLKLSGKTTTASLTRVGENCEVPRLYFEPLLAGLADGGRYRAETRGEDNQPTQ